MGKSLSKSHPINTSLRKKAEGNFPDDFFKVAFKIAKNGFAVLDGSRPIEINDQFLSILKRSRKELGDDLLKYVFKDDIPLVKEENKKNRQVIYEIRVIRGDDSLGYLEIRGHPIVYKGKKCRMLIVRDITEKKINDKLFLNYLNVLEAFPNLFVCTIQGGGFCIPIHP